MVDPVKEHEIPKHVPHADRLPIEERDRAIEVLDRQLLDALQRLAVNALERRRELSNGARPLEAGRLRVAREAAPFDGERSMPLGLGQVPGQLAERSTVRIGPEVILILGQCAEELGGFRGFAIPDLHETFQLVHWLTPPPDGFRNCHITARPRCR